MAAEIALGRAHFRADPLKGVKDAAGTLGRGAHTLRTAIEQALPRKQSSLAALKAEEALRFLTTESPLSESFALLTTTEGRTTGESAPIASLPQKEPTPQVEVTRREIEDAKDVAFLGGTPPAYIGEMRGAGFVLADNLKILDEVKQDTHHETPSLTKQPTGTLYQVA